MTEEDKKRLEQQGEAAATVVAAQPTEVAAEATTQQPQGNWYDAIEKAYAERMKADERADKRDRVRASIAGIGDIASALSNLYFTTQYAPNVPQGNTMSAAQRERADKMKASRDRNRAEWMNYVLNIAGRKQAAEQAEANRQESSRQFNDRMDFYREQEQRRKDEFEFKQQKEQWRQDFEQKKLDQKEKLAIMNADLKKWSERLKMSRSEVAHTLAGYTIDEYEYRDEQGRKHKVKVRSVYNPKTGQLEAEQSDEVQQTTQQPTQQTTQQGNNNTPPSRRQSNNNNTNTPPSRR